MSPGIMLILFSRLKGTVPGQMSPFDRFDEMHSGQRRDPNTYSPGLQSSVLQQCVV
jgi:hypothetical protein